jgi:uncharacterized surface protein with fasciclin (FAS1) repeats
MKHNPLRAILIASVIAIAPAALAETGHRFLIADTVQPRAEGDVLEVAAATGQFSRFLEAVEAAGYAETLRGEGPFTIFAPTDEAFRQMDQREMERLMLPQNRDELVALLSYHVVAERITSEGVEGVVRPESANGYRLTIDGRDGLRVNDQLVAMPDVEASNGVIQGINSVLAPPVMVASR